MSRVDVGKRTIVQRRCHGFVTPIRSVPATGALRAANTPGAARNDRGDPGKEGVENRYAIVTLLHCTRQRLPFRERSGAGGCGVGPVLGVCREGVPLELAPEREREVGDPHGCVGLRSSAEHRRQQQCGDRLDRPHATGVQNHRARRFHGDEQVEQRATTCESTSVGSGSVRAAGGSGAPGVASRSCNRNTFNVATSGMLVSPAPRAGAAPSPTDPEEFCGVTGYNSLE
jgi:hypothetical protein